MRKHLIRWWYTPRWRGDRLTQAIREWNQAQLKDEEVFEDRYAGFSLREMYETADVAVHRLRHRMPYTGSGDLFDPYRLTYAELNETYNSAFYGEPDPGGM
jgi:hypothetical protein